MPDVTQILAIEDALFRVIDAEPDGPPHDAMPFIHAAAYILQLASQQIDREAARKHHLNRLADRGIGPVRRQDE